MKKLIQKFHRGEEGATMVEYALMVALIAVACIVATTALGGSIQSIFSRIGSHLALQAT